MTDTKIFWDDTVIRSPSENLSINRYCADLVDTQQYDLIARIYSHDKGVILGNTQSVDDVNMHYCQQHGYQVVTRPSGGAAIVVDPETTLCYSIFFNSETFKGRFNIHNIYQKMTIPLAQKLGDRFSVIGNYYLRYQTGSDNVPIAGHAIRSYGAITQFDGVINLKGFDMDQMETMLTLRELWSNNGEHYLKVDDHFYTLKGNKVDLDPASSVFMRSERDELEQVIGLENTHVSTPMFKQTLEATLKEIFPALVKGDMDITASMGPYQSAHTDYGSRRLLGHCFVDLVDKEPLFEHSKY